MNERPVGRATEESKMKKFLIATVALLVTVASVDAACGKGRLRRGAKSAVHAATHPLKTVFGATSPTAATCKDGKCPTPQSVAPATKK